MRHVIRLLAGVLLMATLASSGCGKKEDEPPRFNETLGDTPLGAPTGAGAIDTSILKDQAAYTPANYVPLEGGRAGGAGGPEAEAIQAVVRDLLVASFALDIDTMLDSCAPEQVAALREDDYMSTFYETKDTIDQFGAVFKDKATGPEFQPFLRLFELLPQVAEPLANAMTVSILDEQNAVASFDPEKLELPQELSTELETIGKQITEFAAGAMMSGMGAPGQPGAPGETGAPAIPGEAEEPNAAAPSETPAAPAAPAVPGMPPGGFSQEMLQQMMPDLAGMPGAQGGESMQAPQLNLPLRKIDDRWKVVLPFSIQEEQADLINDLMLLVKDLLADVTDQVDQAETLDAAAFMQIMSQTGTRMTPAFIGWWARAKMMMEAAADEAAAAAEPEDEQAAKPETAEEEPNSADTPRTRRERTP